MKILEVKQVMKTYKKQKALDGLDIELMKGEVVGLVGPNGAGKSTLMKIIVDLIRNYDGIAYVDGQQAKENSRAYRQQIGSVIETPGFYPYWSGRDNLKYFAAVAGISNQERIDKVVELLGLDGAINKKVSKYSLGMKQRLAIARALLHSPKLLILDEPTNGLDPNGVSEMRSYIDLIAKEQHVAILIASHVLSEIEKICDKVYIIKKGRVIEVVDLISSEEKNAFVFKSQQTEKIVTVAKRNGYEIFTVEDETFVKIWPGTFSISDMIKEFTLNQIHLNGAYEEVKNLEDLYFEAVGGNQIE